MNQSTAPICNTVHTDGTEQQQERLCLQGVCRRGRCGPHCLVMSGPLKLVLSSRRRETGFKQAGYLVCFGQGVDDN